eukprot:GILJ01025542.1.p1 GENE.GILJ01025542.1~~GILJ01025542.1.p1  ORF type:complete len:232 (+),score=26.48 GILJ01025542.1:45-698(+)
MTSCEVPGWSDVGVQHALHNPEWAFMSSFLLSAGESLHSPPSGNDSRLQTLEQFSGVLDFEPSVYRDSVSSSTKAWSKQLIDTCAPTQASLMAFYKRVAQVFRTMQKSSRSAGRSSGTVGVPTSVDVLSSMAAAAWRWSQLPNTAPPLAWLTSDAFSEALGNLEPFALRAELFDPAHRMMRAAVETAENIPDAAARMAALARCVELAVCSGSLMKLV